MRYLTVAVGAVLPFALTAAVVLVLFRVYRRWRPAAPKPAPAPWRPTVPAARKAPDAEADVQD